MGTPVVITDFWYLVAGEIMHDSETAERERLLAENNYLLARLAETQGKLNSTIASLSLTLQQINKAIVPPKPQRLLSVEEAADILQVTPAAIYKWVSERAIPFRKAGSQTRFVVEELMEWTKPPGHSSKRNDTRGGNVVPYRRS
jgi:excisionase family DNA binding protein